GFSKFTLLDMNRLSEPGALHVRDRNSNRVGVLVITDDLRDFSLFSLLFAHRRLFDESLPEGGIVAAPLEKSKILPRKPRSDVERQGRGFDRKGPGSAHRIDQRVAFGSELGPARLNQDCGCEIFLKRRARILGPVAPLMKAITRKVEA